MAVHVGVLADGFYVEDDGVGLTDVRAADSFERAVTAKVNGTGFGLTTVGAILEARGWSVEARDGGLRVEVPGVGTG